MKGKMKLNYLFDILIGVAFVGAAATGIAYLFMSSGGYQGGRNLGFLMTFAGLPRSTWNDLHTIFGLLMTAGVSAHILLHWDWFVCATRRLFKNERLATVPCPVQE